MNIAELDSLASVDRVIAELENYTRSARDGPDVVQGKFSDSRNGHKPVPEYKHGVKRDYGAIKTPYKARVVSRVNAVDVESDDFRSVDSRSLHSNDDSLASVDRGIGARTNTI